MVEIKEHPMDNCQLFVELRELFQIFDVYTRRLSTFRFWGGNEERIEQLCARVINLLVEHELVNHAETQRPGEVQTLPTGPEAVSHLRGVFILMLVNTEVTTPNRRAPWSLQCQHLQKQMPQMAQFITVVIAMRCGLQQPLLEFLECGPRWATVQYYDILIENLGHVSPNRMEALIWISGTLKAAARCGFRDKEIVREMGRMLHRYLLDSGDRLRQLPKKPRQVYLAKAMVMLLEVMLELLEPPGKPAYFHTYYNLSHETDQQLSQSDPQSDVKPYAKIIMDALQRILEQVTVDTFMSWMEISAPWTLYNYQNLICHQSGEVVKLLKLDQELCKHAVCKQLLTFGKSALTFEELLANMGIGELLAFIDGESGPVTKEQLLLGMECLLHQSIAMGNDECLESMAQHIDLLGLKHGRLILTYLSEVEDSREAMEEVEVEKVEEEDEESDGGEQEAEESDDGEQGEYANLLHHVLMPIFKQCDHQEKIILLQVRDKLRITYAFSYSKPDSQERRIRFFNNLNGQCQPVDDQLLLFFFEDPEGSWLALAKLAMAHSRYSDYFWYVAKHCAPHAYYQMGSIANHLLTDEDALLKCNATSFLQSLYISPLILNGLIKLESNAYRVGLRHDALPYTMKELKAAQTDFLEACAHGLKKFASTLNYTLLQRILLLLQELPGIEKKIDGCGRQQLVQMRLERPSAPEDDPVFAQAKSYIKLHQHLTRWRQAHKALVTQVLVTIDTLRWNLTNFDVERAELLGVALNYWKENFNTVTYFNAGFRRELEACAANCQHQEFLDGNQPQPEDPNYRSQLIRWVTHASAQEATILFRQSLESRSDCVLFFDLAKAVEEANCQNANQAYIFLFECHVKACFAIARGRKREMIQRLASIVGGSPKETVQEVKRKMERFIDTDEKYFG